MMAGGDGGAAISLEALAAHDTAFEVIEAGGDPSAYIAAHSQVSERSLCRVKLDGTLGRAAGPLVGSFGHGAHVGVPHTILRCPARGLGRRDPVIRAMLLCANSSSVDVSAGSWVVGSNSSSGEDTAPMCR